MNKQTMGEFLGVLRKTHGYTQQEVAEKLNVSNRTLSSWETDRTTPDILLLPAIADLYGVTVDELIRGVRGENTENEIKPEFSENALHASRKHRFGKFSTNCIALASVGCFCAALFAAAFILNLYLNTPLWLDLLLWILSSCGVIACGIILFCFKHNLMVTEGIVLSEDYTEGNKGFAFAVERKCVNYLLICALPLLLETLVMLCVFIPQLYKNYYDFELDEYNTKMFIYVISAYLTAILPTAIIGFGLLTAYIVYNYISFIKIANDEQNIIFKTNRKLLIKILGYGCIPVGVLVILFIIIYIWNGCSDIASPIFSTLLALTILICSIIYIVKRKRLKYDFR